MIPTSSGAPTRSEELFRHILFGRASAELRSAAARGALPLDRAQLVALQVALLDDAEEAVRRQARTSLEALSPEACAGLLDDPGCPGTVVDYLARHGDAATAASAVGHPLARRETRLAVAADATRELVQLLLINQVLLAQAPELLEALIANPNATPGQRSRAAEIRERAQATAKSWAAAADAVPDETALEPPPEDRRPAPTAPDTSRDASSAEGAAKAGEEKADHRPLYLRIHRLNHSDKLELALRGDREARLLLARDPDKTVATAVLRNPRLSDNEIEVIARMPKAHEDVLRGIGSRRDAMRNYTVVQSLVRNPRTPIQLALNLIGRLNSRDLRNLIRDRNVAEVVRRGAQRTDQVRSARQKGTTRYRR